MFSGSSDLELISYNFLLIFVHTGLLLPFFYRPLNSPVSIFYTLLYTLYSLFSNLGDFNVNILNPQHPLFYNVQTLASSLCLSKIVLEPTHITQSSRSTIDFVFMSSPSYLISCTTIPALSNSDHLGLLVLFSAGSYTFPET